MRDPINRKKNLQKNKTFFPLPEGEGRVRGDSSFHYLNLCPCQASELLRPLPQGEKKLLTRIIFHCHPDRSHAKREE